MREVEGEFVTHMEVGSGCQELYRLDVVYLG